MRAFRRFMTRALLLGIAAFLIVPMVIPFDSSGTKTNVEAAGANAEFALINDINVHIETEPYSGNQAGNVPLFIMMHGFGASTFSWRYAMDSLSKHGEVLAYDRPAFGFTDRPTSWTGANPYGFAGNFELLDGLISKFGADHPIILVGHSAGGQLAAEYTRLNPDKVQRLILVDPAVYSSGTSPSWLTTLKVIPQIDRLGPFLVREVASSGQDLLKRSYYDQAQLTEEVRAGYLEPLEIDGWERAFWEFSTAPRDNQLKENLGSITQPTLLITGKFDEVVAAADTERLATEIKNSKLVIVENSAHLPQEEQPNIFNSEVSIWITETTGKN
jgi:pimeloyl-ACP methyl ester carboxylesterase